MLAAANWKRQAGGSLAAGAGNGIMSMETISQGASDETNVLICIQRMRAGVRFGLLIFWSFQLYIGKRFSSIFFFNGSLVCYYWICRDKIRRFLAPEPKYNEKGEEHPVRIVPATAWSSSTFFVFE